MSIFFPPTKLTLFIIIGLAFDGRKVRGSELTLIILIHRLSRGKVTLRSKLSSQFNCCLSILMIIFWNMRFPENHRKNLVKLI